jgi:hypothetical protein
METLAAVPNPNRGKGPKTDVSLRVIVVVHRLMTPLTIGAIWLHDVPVSKTEANFWRSIMELHASPTVLIRGFSSACDALVSPERLDQLLRG